MHLSYIVLMNESDTEDHIQKTRHRSKMKKLSIGLIILLLLIAASAGAWYQLVYKGSIPYSYRKKVDNALYYPRNLPDNLKVDRSSFDTPAQDVLTYVVRDSQGNKFYVSQQKLPANFDMASFKKKFEKTDDISTSYGSGFIGDLGNQLVGSVVTNQNSWIIVNTNDVDQQTELEELLRSLSE